MVSDCFQVDSKHRHEPVMPMMQPDSASTNLPSPFAVPPAITLNQPTKTVPSKSRNVRSKVTKKTTKRQQVRSDALAARALKKKRDMHNAVKASIDNAVKILHRTKHEEKPSFHQMPVCIVCDSFIIGTERVHRMSKKTLKKYKPALGVHSYEVFNNERLHPESINQYRVKGFNGMLLSPRAGKTKKGYSTCSSCYNCLRNSDPSGTKPPKFAIANGFAIGTFPKYIPVVTGEHKGLARKIDVEDEKDVSDVMRTLLAPVRPYGYVMAYTGGKHSRIQGHFQFFEMNTEKINAGMHALSQNDSNVSVMLCGPMTKKQKSKIRNMAHIDTQKYIDMKTWLIRNSSKESIKSTPLPQHCFVPKIYDESSRAHYKPGEKSDRAKETSFGGGTYYFSSAHTPSHYTSVFQSTPKFAAALMKNQSPQLFVYGGNRMQPHNADLEDILPLAFPFGTGGPKYKRRMKVSLEECIKRYMRTALPQFMRSDVIFIMQHAYSRQLSYRSGLVKLKNKIGSRQAGDIIGNASKSDFIRAIQQQSSNSRDPMNALARTVSTTCEVLGYTEEAAKKARQNCFAMTDHFGLTSLFLSTTPCDECSFRVRLFANPMGQVSSTLQMQQHQTSSHNVDTIVKHPSLYIHIMTGTSRCIQAHTRTMCCRLHHKTTNKKTIPRSVLT
jgi:hypothetical protein